MDLIRFDLVKIYSRTKVHTQSKVATQEIMKNITILRKIHNPNDIQIAEALLIKENKPTLNSQNEFFERTLISVLNNSTRHVNDTIE